AGAHDAGQLGGGLSAAAGTAAAGDFAVGHGPGQQVGQHAAADIVQAAAVAARVHGPVGEQGLAAQHLAGAQFAQETGLVGLAADRVHLVAGAAVDVHGQHADAAGGAGDHERPQL